MKYNNEYQMYQKILNEILKKKNSSILDVKVDEDNFEEIFEDMKGKSDEKFYISFSGILKIELTYDLDIIMEKNLSLNPLIHDTAINLFYAMFKMRIIPSYNLIAKYKKYPQ